ncbi:MAG: phage major capsid protein [Clostridia bacterium]|nr:phage major capsid protein [Clostridia bacterium]
MFKNVKAKSEEMNDLITRAESIVNTAEVEKRELTDAEAQELAEIRDNVKAIKDYLGIDKDLDEAMEAAKEDGRACGDEQRSIQGNVDSKELEETRAFENYVRGVVLHERAGELAPANNGAIIPTTIARKIVELVYDICPILDKSEKYNVKGKLEIPYYPADSSTQITVAFATEFTDLASSTGNFTTIELSGYLAGALTKISKSLINNVEFDVVGFIVKRMAYDIARFLEANLLGKGSGSVVGLGGATNVTTVTSAITADDVITMQGTIKDIYQANAIWIMSPATRDALRLLKDDVGRYLLNDDISAPFGKTLLGKPVYVSDNMDDIASGNTVIYYGDMSGLATKFSEEMHVEVLRELYAAQHAVGVVGWVEFDAKIQDQQKIAVMKMS